MSNFAISRGGSLARAQMTYSVARLPGWTTPDHWQSNTFVSSRRNAMFWKKCISLSHETPTSAMMISGHGSSDQKKISKTQCFFNVFFGGWNLMRWIGTSSRPQKWKKRKKTICFSMFFVIQPRCQNQPKMLPEPPQKLPSRLQNGNLAAILVHLIAYDGSSWRSCSPSCLSCSPSRRQHVHQFEA